MKSLITIVAAAALALGACKKNENAPVPSPSETTPVKPADTAPPADKPADTAAPQAAADVDNADYVRVVAKHKPAKPTDPVMVTLKGFQVVKATFDPAKVEGGTADLELDLASLDSGIEKRNNHLKSPDFLDVAKFAKASIHVDNVKKTGDNAYSADATVDIHGVQKKYPVAFSVVETLPDGIRIKGEHTFTRHDFKIGPPESPEEGVANDLTVQLQLTLKKS